MKNKDAKELLELSKLGIEVPTFFSVELQKIVPNMDGVRGILELFESIDEGEFKLTGEELKLATSIKGTTRGSLVIIEVSTLCSLMFPGFYSVKTTLRTAGKEGCIVDYIGTVVEDTYSGDDFNEGIVKAVKDIKGLEQFISRFTDRQVKSVFHLSTTEELDKEHKDSLFELEKHYKR